ncbi:RNA polymerase sigma factor [Nocardioides psychrotolerans]|uniref:RNA polymerase sigma factor n=1 Tax=Nocardioides psychrotolerans TaxID=1005945 RepID=UPI000A970403|nr:sigma-70 family RNA polymerase sigma factor [Nocardioides psychrotolerans]
MESDEAARDREVARVYARTCGPLIGLLTVMGGSAADAEEVAQDAFVKLLDHWEKVQDYEDIDGWLRIVAVRLLISRSRRRQVATLGLARLRAGHDSSVAPPPSETRLDVVDALAGLPVGHRAVVLLHHVHDLSIAEVAALLRLPAGTVKSRLSRARAALTPLLADPDPITNGATRD